MPIKSDGTDLRIREHFDGQLELYVDCHREKHLSICIERMQLLNDCIPAASVASPCLLDIGCGAGYFADEFLRHFPRGSVIGVDVSSGMLTRNAPDSRKMLLLADARALPLDGRRFDVINFDTVLHHIIHPAGHRSTLAGLVALLSSLRDNLRPGGTIMIREIYHELRFWRGIACRSLFALTRAQLPGPLARLIRTMGIQTANVGVCFLTRPQWHEVFRQSGFEIASATDHRWRSPLRFAGLVSGEVYYYLKSVN